MSPPSSAAPVVVAARRTPVGTAGHGLAGLTVDRLAAPVLADVAGRVAVIDHPVDEVILGNCLGPGGNVARVSALAAGLEVTVPAVTVDRQCGSGLDAVLQGAARIRAGEAGLVLAGGAESASTAPWRYWPPGDDGSAARRYTRAPFAPAGFPDPDMGVAADALARVRRIDRARQDEYAARSHSRAYAASTGAVFADEIVPVAGLSADERPRDAMTAARLARLRPSFSPDGTATAGNSCGISDGAAAVALASVETAHAHRLPGLRVVASAVAGCDPALPGLGIAAATARLLRRTDVRVKDIGAVEITEAFASIALAAIDDLGLDPEIVCSDGGAIGLGHPWGASGALLVVRLFHRMLAPRGARIGLAACAIGGGQGIAMLVERTGSS